MVLIGLRYYTGKGIQRNYETAVSWFRMAAEQGVAHAMTHLSICYYAGLGVEYNPREAFGLIISWHPVLFLPVV